MGVFLSADLYTTFLFFELMSLSSYAWVVQEESPDALDAGKTYLTIAVLGGLVTPWSGCWRFWTAGWASEPCPICGTLFPNSRSGSRTFTGCGWMPRISSTNCKKSVALF